MSARHCYFVQFFTVTFTIQLICSSVLDCTGAKTVVRTVYGNSNSFEIKVGMHQGAPLSPLLFVIVMEALAREFRVTLPWELLYADDLVVIAETEDDLIKRLIKRHESKYE